MDLPICPSCQRNENVELFTKSEVLPPPKGSELLPTQWVAYTCKRCKTAYVRLEPVEE